ncbi:type I glutamate--ammonia ligase, partial [Lactobacillus sp. XV13L]|nr:type I glutamate--ammonia ligase [Lactobacillus sp. XV13L]
GMQNNMSLFNEQGNAFYDPQTDNQLSQTMMYFLNGLMEHSRGLTAINNPTVNSYKRLVPGFEAPVYIAWSGKNRSPLIRIPMARKNGTRLEMRNVDPTANPYLAIAAILSCGLQGIKEQKLPVPPVNRNIYTMSEEERHANKIYDLPSTLHNAIKALKQDPVVVESLGEHLYKSFFASRDLEWSAYRRNVSEREREQYLKRF